MRPVRKTPSKVPTPPTEATEATGAPSRRMLPRLNRRHRAGCRASRPHSQAGQRDGVQQGGGAYG